MGFSPRPIARRILRPAWVSFHRDLRQISMLVAVTDAVPPKYPAGLVDELLRHRLVALWT
jgi:hypothetical protein